MLGKYGAKESDSGSSPVAVEAKQKAPAAGGRCGWKVHFSPAGGCTAAVVSALEGAKREVRVQAYSFTSAPIASALRAAHKRGVDVQVILDEAQRGDKYSAADFLARSGIPTWIDARPGLQHNKVIVIDAAWVITGSFNFTRAAEERNRENLLVLEDPQLAAAYADNWERDRAACEAYDARN